jgi:hypothetical protein
LKITEDYFYDQLTDKILIQENGYPVRPFIINDVIIITPEEIGTFVIFHDDDTEDFVDFGVTEMNFILREFDGWLDILIDEDTLDDRLIEPIYDENNNNKVILKFIDNEEEYINDEEE